MSSAVITLLSLSVSGSLLALALLALRPLMKSGCMKAFGYYVWLIVLVRLILPVSAPMNAMEALFSDMPVSAAQQEAAISVHETGAGAPATGDSVAGDAAVAAPDAQTQPAVREQTAAEPQNAAAEKNAFDLWAFIKGRLLWIWAAGACVNLLWYVTGYLRFLRQIKSTSTPPLPA